MNSSRRGDLRRPLDFVRLRRVGMAEGDVRRHRVAEQKALLKHDADVPPQVVEIEFANVDAVDRNRAAVDVVKPRDQAQQRALAGARFADDAQALRRRERRNDTSRSTGCRRR